MSGIPDPGGVSGTFAALSKNPAPSAWDEPMEFRFAEDLAPIRGWLVDGEPQFVAMDIAMALDYRMASDMTRRLDADERGTRPVRTPGGIQDVTVITESGLYSAILGSRIPAAKAFKRWITREVLPALRRTGTYSTVPALTGPELVAAALIEANKMLTAKDELIAELEPKAELANTYLTAQGGARLVRQVAKTLGMTERNLRRFLLDDGLIYTRHSQCGEVQYDHYAQYAHHFLPREKVVEHQWGSCSHYTLYILPRGIELISKRLRAKGIAS